MKTNSIHKRRRIQVVLLTIGLLVIWLAVAPRVLILSGHLELAFAIGPPVFPLRMRGLTRVEDFRRHMSMTDALSIIQDNDKCRIVLCGDFESIDGPTYVITNHVIIGTWNDPEPCLVRNIWNLSYNRKPIFVDLRFEGNRIVEISAYGPKLFM